MHRESRIWRLMCVCSVFVSFAGRVHGLERKDVRIDQGWRVQLEELTYNADITGVPTGQWFDVDLPHQFNDYNTYIDGDTQIYGTALYERDVTIDGAYQGGRVFAWFEGAGHYATVYINGNQVAHHRGGKVGFEADLTDHVNWGVDNHLEVRVEYPRDVKDIPWMDGANGGGSHLEGTQPFGIFRPVHLVYTGAVRVPYFGTYAFTPNEVTTSSVPITIWTEVTSHESGASNVTVTSEVIGPNGAGVATVESSEQVQAGETRKIVQQTENLSNPQLWSPSAPHLYTLKTTIKADGEQTDTYETRFGIRWLKWPGYHLSGELKNASGSKNLLVNNQPVPVRGICEYEQILGGNHAFTDEQVASSCRMMHDLGFNAFRDAHHPHNLRYYDYWDEYGIICWPQITSNPNMKMLDLQKYTDNMKIIIEEYVKERRNHPSVALWGIYNEGGFSDFGDIKTGSLGEMISNLISELDPTAPQQRLRVNCKGGGLDWSIPQYWGGTYADYDYPGRISSDQGQMYGEYGAFINLGFHNENVNWPEKIDDRSEEYACALHSAYINVNNDMKNQYCGHFAWVFNSFVVSRGGYFWGCWESKAGDGIYRMSCVNPKGLLTSWRQPMDLYHVYYGAYGRKPSVYIVSHTWGDRGGGSKKITVYSNCDEVELFNGYKTDSYGSKSRNGLDPFVWDGANIQKNLLYAEGKMGGQVVAADAIVLEGLPEAGSLGQLDPNPPNTTGSTDGLSYAYRINCGGPDYNDRNGQTWQADKSWDNNTCGVINWAERSEYDAYDPIDEQNRRDFGSIGAVCIPVKGTEDDELYNHYRWGRTETEYRFKVDPGKYYAVELHTLEPWYGAGAPEQDCAGWRLFDIAVEGKTVEKNFDIWQRAGGYGTALKQTIHNVQAADGVIELTFPHVASNQWLLSGIAVAEQTAGVGVHSRGTIHAARVTRRGTTFRFAFPEAVNAEITAVSLNGRTVARGLVHKQRSWSVDTGTLSPGVYVLRLSMDGATRRYSFVVAR